MAGLSLLQWKIKREPGQGDYEPIRCVVGRLHRPHSRAVHENRTSVTLDPIMSDATMTEAEMQAAMAEVAMVFGRKETL